MRSECFIVVLVASFAGGCGLVGFQVTPIVEDGGEDATVSDAGDAATEDAGDAAAPDAAVVALCPAGDCKAVFLSPPMGVATVGGVDAADTHCQQLAIASGLGGTFRAWISDSISSPSTRFTRAAVPYKLINGAV